MSLTDSQIKQLSKRMNIPLAGVFFKDELPINIQPNKTYLINLQDSVDKDGQLNDGTHWTMAQYVQYPNGKKASIYFDSYGMPPPEVVKERFSKASGMKSIPHTEKDIQSLMNNACGFYCLALAHYINASMYRTGDLYTDVDDFIEMFDDLNKSIDFKKNEFILKHFFRSEDINKRSPIDNIKPIDSISSEDEKGGIDAFKNIDTGLQVDVKYINK